MTLLAPAALWTLAALALPLTVHLWRRPPRTVRLGSLRFLQASPRRWQNLRWRELALLLTRLALLAALALGLARPVRRQPPPARAPRWALLDPAAAPAGPSLDRLHALQAAGGETRLLAPAFPTIPHPPADASAPAPDLWSLLREADATLPTGSSLAVFSPGRLASLRGVRPALAHARIEWVNTPAVPLRSAPPPRLPAVAPPLTLLILHDADRAEDARYLHAAALAAFSGGGRSVTVIGSSTTAPYPPVGEWVFWLGARPVPAEIADHFANVLSDAAGPIASGAVPGWIIPQPGAPGAEALIAPVRLWQRGPAVAGSAIWTDGFGQPLLTRVTDPHGTHWHFASRFHPAWNDLPLGTALPAALRALLAADKFTGNDDPRLADPAQCLPAAAAPSAAPAPTSPGPGIDGRPPLWLLAAGLFCLERFLSHRRAALSPVASPTPAVGEPALSR